MDYSAIGKKIIQLRKTVGLTQNELAKGICTQGMISRIEKGDIFPNASTLYHIANKLGVDLNYFFDVGSTPRLEYVMEVVNQLKKLRKNLQYDAIMDIVRREEKNDLFTKNPVFLQQLLWHKGIYEKEVMELHDKAFQTLQQSLELTYDEKKALSESEINIMLSLGVFHFSKCQYDEALEIYDRIRKRLKTHSSHLDHRIKTRLYYNIARVLTRLGRYDASIQDCKKGIKWCFENESLYLVGELYYQIGYNAELLGDIDTAYAYLNKSTFLFRLQNKDQYSEYIKIRMQELNKKSKEKN